MPFYCFNQNNTGGSFVTNDVLCHRVVIEADSASDANKLALDIGIYFDGVAGGCDCGCCGDRWCEAYGKGDSYPYKYSDLVFQTPEEHYKYFADNYGWTTPDARILYKDGRNVDVFKSGTENVAA